MPINTVFILKPELNLKLINTHQLFFDVKSFVIKWIGKIKMQYSI